MQCQRVAYEFGGHCQRLAIEVRHIGDDVEPYYRIELCLEHSEEFDSIVRTYDDVGDDETKKEMRPL